MYGSLRAQTTGEYETRELLGKEYIVVPVVAMIEGVRFGANQSSAELGLASEFGKFAAGWNTSPVVMNHPSVDGQFVSAGDPKVLDNYYLGQVYNAQLDNKKLKMEAWLDPDTKDKGDDFARVFERIEEGEVIEVSVGFFTEVEEKTGKFKGQKYNGVWRNIVPDHLAFLEEGATGACSVEDGCGTPRTNSQKGETMPKAKPAKGKKKTKAMEDASDCQCKQAVQVLRTNVTADDEVEVEGAGLLLNEQEVAALNSFIAQAIPSDLLSSDIIRALGDKLSDTQEWPYVLGFTNEYVVFSAYTRDGYQLYRQNFDIDSDGGVTFTSEPEEVRLITKIVGTDSGDVNVNTTKETDMPKSTDPKVQQEEQTPTTEPKAEDKVETEGEASATEAEAPATQTETEAEPTAQTQPAKPVTVNEYIKNAPVEIQEVLQSSLSLHNSRKEQLIKNLKATDRCKFDDTFLKSQNLETLERMAELADVPSYEGASAPVRTQSADDNSVPAAPKVFERKQDAA